MSDHENTGSNGAAEARDTLPDAAKTNGDTPGSNIPADGANAPAALDREPEQASEPYALPGSQEETDWHVEAGRKGGRRFHELIERGRMYEQEHGLKRGRQRLRQLIQEGRLYEQEHGLATRGRRSRGTRSPRMDTDQLLQTFCRILYRLAKPAHRDKIARMLQALDGEGQE